MVLVNVGGDRATAVAERIRAAFEQLVIVSDGRRIKATVSIGVALCAGHKFDVTTLLSQADQALYRAKNLGRNRVERAMEERDVAPNREATGALAAAG